MKTINVSDEMYSKLMELAKEYVTQDNRATAMPYLFQIREQVKEWDTDGNGDTTFFYDKDDVECQFETLEELREYYDDVPDVDDINDLYYSEEWLEEKGLIQSSYSYRSEYRNAFLTAKACKEHIASNHYHYNEPVDYLNCAWRNPEMDLISQFLKTLSTQETN